MSKENVKSFYELVGSNKELAEKLTKSKNEASPEIDAIEQILIPMAKEQGLSFSKEEFLEYTKSLEKLSREEFIKMSGGANATQKFTASAALALTVFTPFLGSMASAGDTNGDTDAPNSSYSQNVKKPSSNENHVSHVPQPHSITPKQKVSQNSNLTDNKSTLSKISSFLRKTYRKLDHVSPILTKIGNSVYETLKNLISKSNTQIDSDDITYSAESLEEILPESTSNHGFDYKSLKSLLSDKVGSGCYTPYFWSSFTREINRLKIKNLNDINELTNADDVKKCILAFAEHINITNNSYSIILDTGDSCYHLGTEKNVESENRFYKSKSEVEIIKKQEEMEKAEINDFKKIINLSNLIKEKEPQLLEEIK